MNYLQKKKLAFMSVVNSVKGFVRNITGVFPLTLTNCVDSRSIIDYTMYGNSVQNGTPTPDTPIEVESVGEYDEESGKYKIPITVSGKNLIANWNAGWCTAQGVLDTANYPNRRYTDFIPIKPNTSYRVSGGGANSNWTLYDENYNYLQGQIFGSSRTVKPSSAKFVRIAHPNTKVEDFQLEEGTTATEYEPYHEPITTDIYLDEPLRKVGDYDDYIDFENGKVVRHIQKYTFTGTEEFQRRSDYSNKTTKYSLSGTLERYVGISCMSNIGDFENGTNADATGKTGVGLYVDNKTTSRMVYIEVPYKYNTVESLSTYLSTNKVYVMYPLATPTEELIILPNLPTFKGTSIISVGTAVQPSNAEIEYYSTEKE